MTTTTTTAFATDDPTPDPVALLADLEYRGRRLAEELETLQKQESFLQSEIARHEAELVTANEALAALPKDATAHPVFDAKTVVIAIEFNRDLLKEQLAALQPELLETPKLIAQNEKAVAAAKAELP